jgi:hypothetical protein
MTDSELDAAFAAELDKRGKRICPVCAKVIDRGDVAWNQGSTEAGTDYSVVEIQCEGCQTEIGHFATWYDVSDFDDVIRVMDDWDA